MKEKKEQKCKACGFPFLRIKGTNVIACSNPDCDGKMYYTDKDGNKKYKYINTYFIMDSQPLSTEVGLWK